MEETRGSSPAVATSKLTGEQYALVRFLEQEYWKTSALPSYEAIVADGTELDRDLYLESWANPRFVDALRARGLPEHVLNTKSAVGFSGKTLTEQQMTVANVLLDVLDTRSRIKKLTELGVPTSTYNLWLRDPVYRNYCLERAESLLQENQPVAHMSLINRVNSGDLGAIKYFNAMTGRYRERERAAVEVNVNQFGNDKLIAIVEIIQRHVKDPATLEAIAGDILALNNPMGGATRLPLSGSSYIGELVYSKDEMNEQRI
jgi:hypothetical protein